MKVITEPNVYIVGRQTVDQSEMLRFLGNEGVPNWTTDTGVAAEVLAEASGRICYASFNNPRPGGNAAYLKHIKEVGHGNLAEHAVWSLVVTGISRALSHELVRHRTMSPSQLSQRYVDESVAEYVCPPFVQESEPAYRLLCKLESARSNSPAVMWQKLNLQAEAEYGSLKALAAEAGIYATWLRAVERAHHAYCELGDKLAAKMAARADMTPTERRKTARQAARSVLPNATETKLFLTINARSLRATIEQRCSRHADTEIRILFGRIWEVMAKEAPNLFNDYSRVDLPDGTFELTTAFRKV